MQPEAGHETTAYKGGQVSVLRRSGAQVTEVTEMRNNIAASTGLAAMV